MTIAGKRIAVLGAGIMGSALALMLARRGAKVDLIDREAIPMNCASRWNEGKIHLGYIYGADPTLQTARHVIPGGLRFGPLLRELIDADIAPQVTRDDDLLLVHRDSVADATGLAPLFERISAILRDHADAAHYLTDVSAARAQAMTPKELAAVADTNEIVAGFRVPERSVNTQWIADRVVEALASQPNITACMNQSIASVTAEGSDDGPWRVRGAADFSEAYDIVINALWNGRPEVDQSAGIEPKKPWTHRYRLSLFVRTARPVQVASAIVAVGPFGDVKNYNDRDYYLSWYPAGLVLDSDALNPAIPDLTPELKVAVTQGIRDNLQKLLPPVAGIFMTAESVRVEGGFVFAQGQGSLSDPASTLHQRNRFGIQRRGNYFSVDTGKYSTAPWLAENLALMIAGDK